MLNAVKQDLDKLKKPAKAKLLQRFFKTGKGEYGQGDVFLGITVPEQRKIAQKYRSADLSVLKSLLNSKIHEYRLIALLILVDKFKKADSNEQKQIFNFYLKNFKNINNWDLVDLSAPKIVGPYLLDKDRQILYKLAQSKNLWERRIALLACFAFINNNEFEDALKISQLSLSDQHDLIHKASGWLLREIGKKDEKVLMGFLKKFQNQMPRTMLRYSIERLEEKVRKKALQGKL